MKSYLESPLVIQSYIHNPVLIQKKKVDFRAYVLFAQMDPPLVLFHHGFPVQSYHEFQEDSADFRVYLTTIGAHEDINKVDKN
jgi:hypothetical protein